MHAGDVLGSALEAGGWGSPKLTVASPDCHVPTLISLHHCLTAALRPRTPRPNLPDWLGDIDTCLASKRCTKEKLHSIIPNNPEVIFQIAQLHERHRNLHAAVKWYNILITRVPSDPGVLSDIFARVGGPDSTAVQAARSACRSGLTASCDGGQLPKETAPVGGDGCVGGERGGEAHVPQGRRHHSAGRDRRRGGSEVR